MKNSDFMIEWIEELRALSNNLTFEEGDIRYDFFISIIDCAYCYYRSYLLVEISTLIYKEQINIEKFKHNVHLKAVQALIKNELSYKSHFNSLNRQLIIDSWSTFELYINLFCEFICDEGELQKLLSTKYNETIKLIGKKKIDDSSLSKLKKEFVSNNLTHIPIVRKTDIIFKKIVGYSRNIDEDKNFLLFFGRLRNSLHSNFIYHGKSFEYKYGHAKFIFNDGEIIKWNDPFKETPKLYFYLVGNLKEIWKAIVLSIKYEMAMPYPYEDHS